MNFSFVVFGFCVIVKKFILTPCFSSTYSIYILHLDIHSLGIYASIWCEMWIRYFFRDNSLFISLSTSVDGQKFPGFCYYTFFKTINLVDYHLYTYKHTEGYICRGEFARSKHMSIYNLNPVFLLRGIMPIQSLLLETLQDRFKKEASNLCWISTLAAARTPPWDLSMLFSRGVQPTG